MTLIADQYDYIECSAVYTRGLYTVLLQYTKIDQATGAFSESTIISTLIQATTLGECAVELKKVMALGFFHLPISDTGSVYDEYFKELGDVDWMQEMQAYLEHGTPERVFH